MGAGRIAINIHELTCATLRKLSTFRNRLPFGFALKEGLDLLEKFVVGRDHEQRQECGARKAGHEGGGHGRPRDRFAGDSKGRTS